MALALGAIALVALVLVSELAWPRTKALRLRCGEALARRRARRRRAAELAYDPGRELRAEQRARALLRSCVNEEEWAMYRDLGFLRVWGGGRAGAQADYGYLIYPHKPIVAFLPQSGAILNEYCVAFASRTGGEGGARLPDADDVLAKWMLLAADERTLLEQANMHMPGRQVDPEQVRADLARLSTWERARGAQRPRPTAQTPGRRSPALTLGGAPALPELANRAGPR
jgi:hypothetical protein